jgi:tetratricopeptide (TPR) repeat protein
MELFIDAKLTWNLDALYADLSSIKTLELTDWEKTCLRGLLCGVHPQAIASKIFWTASALKTELSRRIYPYISTLVDEKVGSWHRVAQLVEKAGYKCPEVKILRQELFCLDCSIEPQLNSKLIRFSAIVKLLETKLSKNKDLNSIESSALSKLELEQIDRGDRSLNRNDFLGAIESYREALITNPFPLSILVKVARCYEELKFYKEALFICDFVLDSLERDRDLIYGDKNYSKSTIYKFLAGLFHQVALSHYSADRVKTAFEIYQRYLYFCPEDILALWKIVELFVSVFKDSAIASAEKQDYLDRAKKALYDLKGNARRLDSNFKLERDLIVGDAKQTFQGLDWWWQEQLQELKSW